MAYIAATAKAWNDSSAASGRGENEVKQAHVHVATSYSTQCTLFCLPFHRTRISARTAPLRRLRRRRLRPTRSRALPRKRCRGLALSLLPGPASIRTAHMHAFVRTIIRHCYFLLLVLKQDGFLLSNSWRERARGSA